jgi:AraC-like DNA-binding protein
MNGVQRLDWIVLVTLLGAVQGVFLAGALATKRRNRLANRLLASMMLAFSLGLATQVYHALQLEREYPHFFGVGYPMPFLYGPLVYLYSRFAADRSRPFTARDALHLVPFVLIVLLTLPVYAMSGPNKMEFLARLQAGNGPAWVGIADWLKFLSGTIYTVATILFLRKHRKVVEDSYSSTERVNLQWLFWLGIAAASIWAFAIAYQVAQAAGWALDASGDRYISLAVSIMVYAIGYRALRQPEIFRYDTAEMPVPRAAPAPAAKDATAAPVEEPSGPRYERSGLGERQAERLKTSLLAVMEREQPWKSSDLTLATLADRLGTTPHKLSEVLNTELGQTFYDFVNGYRVRDVQRRIEAGETRQHKLLTLAMDAGFASKSTFNLAFKKHTNRTPSDYRVRSSTP